MRTAKRAWLYIARQPMRKVTLFLLLFVMLFLSLLGFSFCDAARELTAAMRGFLQGHILLTEESGAVTDEVVSRVQGTEGVSGVYPMDGVELSFPELGVIGGVNADGPTGYLLHLTGGDASRHPNFVDDTFSLWEGEYTSESTQGKLMISRDLALLNGIGIGDTVTGYYQEEYGTDDVSNPITFEIIGIFQVQTKEDPHDFPTWEVPQNQLFCDNAAIRAIRMHYAQGEDINDYADGAVVRAQDAGNLSDLAKKLQRMYPEMNITVDDRAFAATAVPLSRMEQTVRYLLILVLVMSMIVLSLVLVLWVRNRDREVGIYLSMGISKKDIRMQLVLESFWVAAAAFALAYPAAAAASGSVCSVIQNTTSALMHFSMTVSFGVFVLCALIGLLIVMGATLLSAAMVLRLRPKEILSTMS